MCGIAGIVSSGEGIHPQWASRMSAAIAHRGPDDSGTWADGHIALAHRRLSIIDTSTTGHQPMISHDGRYVMVYNGEIYNYIELHRELQDRGVVFHGHSDSEVLLEAFAAYGADCLRRFNGMWALAIWDRTTRRLFVARDRFGVKPFYYTIHRGNFLFASEIKALLATESSRCGRFLCRARVGPHHRHVLPRHFPATARDVRVVG
jgi:asparagine synthase (glutamine-hydrolysing)